MSTLNIERFEGLFRPLTHRIRHFAPRATCSLSEGPHGYFCISWYLNHAEARQLFVEQAGSRVTPFELRVGIYFADVLEVTQQPLALQTALEALLNARATLQPLGVVPTLTQASGNPRDPIRMGWTEAELRDWLTRPCPNHDFVWLWDLHQGEPSDQQIESVLVTLIPVWQAWNAL